MFQKFVRRLAVAALCACTLGIAQAQTFPSKPIRIVLGFGVGGGADALARLYAVKLGEVLNTQVVVENKPSAYELVAGQVVAGAPADGYTLWMTTTGGLVQAPLLRNLPYHPVRNFTPLGVVAEADAVFAVKKGSPIRSMDELVAYARENPGKLNYGSAGTGAPSHLLVEYLQVLTDTRMTHIPYKSAGDVVRELAGGTIDFAVAVPASAAPLVHEGRINAIAVTAPKRLDNLPEVPTLGEGNIRELKEMGTYVFYAVLGPAGLPPAVAKTLSDAFNKVAAQADMQQKSRAMSVRATTSSPTELRQRIEKDTASWSEVAKRIKF